MNGYLLWALLIGVAVPLQVGLNTTLGRLIGHPMLSATVSFTVGALSLWLLIVAWHVALPSVSQWVQIPGWYYLGGILGAFFVASTIILAPRLSVATMNGLIVAGQLLMSLVIDHFGWFGFPHHPITLLRVLGVLLILAGVWLVQRF